jgi:hypothetical protein
MTFVNQAANLAFDTLMRPLQPLDVGLALAIVSCATAVAVLLVMRVASNQKAMAATKRQIHADVFEIRLFNDDPGAIRRAVAAMLRHNATYLRLSLVPMLWVLGPLAITIAQLQFFFGYSGVPTGEPVLVTAQFKAGVQPIALAPPESVRVVTQGISFPTLNQTVWKVVATTPGDYLLRLEVAGETYEKTLHVSSNLARRSPLRPGAQTLITAAYPSETPLPARAPLEAIRVEYPESYIQIFGWLVHWTVAYTVFAMAFAIVLKRPLRVTI